MTMMKDELLELWQESARPRPDRAEVARLAGRVAMGRFDRAIRARNLREYATGVLLFAFFGWQLWRGRAVGQSLVALAAVSFVLGFLFFQHRNRKAPDPAASAREYQAAMLGRIDDQIRLLGSMRYWYLLPLYVPILWIAVTAGRRSPVFAGVFLAVGTGLFVAVGWLNERVGVRRLRAERAKIEALFSESGGDDW